jgi:membrane-associated PAP2 superfamily phosphatase
MNRTGLLIALAIAAVVGIVFGLHPEFDLRLSQPFYEIDRGGNKFGLRTDTMLMWVRETAMWLVTAIALVPGLALATKIVWPRSRLKVPGRAIVFLLTTLALAPGLWANVILKDNWGRPRPIDVPQFGGEEPFKAWWDPRGICPKNCSFVTGDGSGAFWTMAPAALAPAPWQPVAFGAAIAFGAGVGVLRMSFGGHFFTDVVFAGVFTFVIIWLVQGYLYRWPRTRTTDEAIERGIERIAIPPHDFVMRFFGKGSSQERP